MLQLTFCDFVSLVTVDALQLRCLVHIHPVTLPVPFCALIRFVTVTLEPEPCLATCMFSTYRTRFMKCSFALLRTVPMQLHPVA
jgi:hypothetical protein